ncbi:MAG: RDD family protein [Methanobrevibacter sp.]|nr:RDD family protein [Methanobrevibacter sp.]
MVSIFTKRVLAYIADYFVVSAIMWVIVQILYFIFPSIISFAYEFIILAPVVGFIYFVILEVNRGATVGKHLLFLEVVSTLNFNYFGKVTYKQAILRNLSKIYWVPIIIDLLIGRLIGSSNERILGRISRTEVINER